MCRVRVCTRPTKRNFQTFATEFPGVPSTQIELVSLYIRGQNAVKLCTTAVSENTDAAASLFDPAP